MKLSPPEPLNASHVFDGFDCGVPSLNEWLIRHSRQAQSSGSAKTFVCADSGGLVVGYYSLAAGHVETSEVPARIAKGMGRYPIPLVVLARLAVSRPFQWKGVGSGLLRDAIVRTLEVSRQVGIHAILTHPIDEKARLFYLRYGFEGTPVGPDHLILLLKDAKKLLE